MTIILTTSRRPSTRVRQFIKEFSSLFPRSTVKIVNRGKHGIEDFFSNYTNIKAVCVVTARKGNPGSIVVYMQEKNKPFWSLEFKISRVLLRFELQTKETEYPDTTVVFYSQIQFELKSKLKKVFDIFLDNNSKNSENINSSNNRTEIIVSYSNPGFTITAKNNKFGKKEKISPEIDIFEILTEDV